MAWTSPRTWVLNEVVTPALLNTHLRDNLNATATATVTTAGDTVYATAANTLARLAIGTANKVLVSTGSAPAWSDVITNLASSGTTSLGALPTAGEGNFMLGGRIANNSTPNNGVDLGGASTSDNGVISVTKTNGALQFVYYDGANYVEQMRLAATNIYLNDTSNANQTRGITINSGAADERICFKYTGSSNSATNMTEGDTCATLGPIASYGGLLMSGYEFNGSTRYAVLLRGVQTITDATKSNAAYAAVEIRGCGLSANSAASLGANANIASFSDNGTVRFILDADGDSHQDVGTAWTNFDDRDDAAALNLLAAHVTRPDDPLRQNFGQWLAQSREPLEAARLVTFNDDGHHFVNMSRLTMLLTGAVRQLSDKLQAQAAELDTLRSTVKALTA